MQTALRAFRPLILSAHCLCALAFLVLAAPMCAAATYYVAPSGSDNNAGTSAAPYLTIQTAIANAASGDTVIVKDGTYTGVGDVDIDLDGNNITLTSLNGAATTIIDCAGSSTAIHRGFYLHSGEGKNAPAVIRGFTVKSGYESNNNNRGGGGMFIANTDNITVQNCVFTANTSALNGGAIENDGSVALTNCTFSNNAANNGNGGGLYSIGTATLTDCTFNGDTSNFGGGIHNTGMATLTNCSYIGNTAGRSGGGFYNSGTATVTSCTFKGNTATTYYSSDGGGGFCTSGSGTATVVGTSFTNNVSGQIGGGLYNDNATLTLTGCLISGNTATNNVGGGLYNDGGSNALALRVSLCTFSGNSAPKNDGGAMYLTQYYSSSNDTAAISNCLIVGNKAGNDGGGICNNYDALTVQFTTSSGNTAGNQGGGLYVGSGTATLTDDILYNDIGGEAVDGTSSGTSVTVNYCDVKGGFAGTGNFDKKPLFVNPNNSDYHLQSGSPCIGAGTPITGITTDLDGKTRANPPTMGCYEGPTAVTATSHTHLLWNNSDGRVMLWSIAQDGTFTLNGFGPYTDGAPQNKWTATAVATGADGKSHLLWNNTDGRVMLWTVDDAGNFTLAGYGPYTDNAPDNKWNATAVSVGPDGTVHLLWNNTDHRAMLWSVAPDFSFSLAGYGPYTDNGANNLWSATALSTGPDGVSHILWNNTDNRVMLWNVAPSFSFTLAGFGPYTDGAPQNLWSAAGLSVGPDNVQHILWTNTDRRAMFWNVDSSFGFTLAGFGPYTDNAPGNLWSAAAVATGPDGLSHLLWDNPDNRAMLWGVDSAFGFTVAGYGPYTDNAPGNLWSATAVSAGP